METILVTGGCGFIGSHFVRRVLRRPEWRVVNLDKLTYAGNVENLTDLKGGRGYRFVKGDIADRAFVEKLLQEERPWAVVNFAAESHVDRSILDPSPFLQTNILGVEIMLEAALRHGVKRFLQISTDEIYGDADGKEPFDEESAPLPSSPYAASKAAADLLCLAYRRTHGLPVVIVRSSNNYGPYQFPEKLIPLTVRNALLGEDLPVYGDGLQRRDWLYVQDNCGAIWAVLERGSLGSVYNVAAGEARTNLEMVREICRLVAEEGKLSLDALLQRIRFVPDRPGHDRSYALSTKKIQAELGWLPQTDLEEGMRTTVRWYLEHKEWLERVTSGEFRAYYDAVYRRGWKGAKT
jgi:dTDP-glucose 4,6-dehydratase